MLLASLPRLLHNTVVMAADWDAVANTTLYLESNSTIFANGDDEPVTAVDIIYYILSILAFVAFCFCSRSRIPDERFRIAAAERRARYLQREERIERMSDPAYRQGLVEKALVVKKVVEEKDGQLTLGDAGQDDDDDDASDDLSSGGGSISIDSTDENVSTCVICLEAFRVGDVVAWSRGTTLESATEMCNHVFHKECIIGWLMHSTEMHDFCPSCRAPIVQEEQDGGSGGEMEDEHEQMLPEDGPDPYASTAFVIIHGLVSRVRRASYSLIGQSIDIQDDMEDIETGNHNPPKQPPSPMRRVFSLEASSRGRSSSLRRRPSSRSVTSRSASLRDITLGDGNGHDNPPPPPPPRRAQSISPLVLRRVVSDVARALPDVPLVREASGGLFSLSLRPRGRGYERVSSFSSDHHGSEHSISEVSEDDEEDEIMIRQVASLRESSSIGQSLSDPTDEEDEQEGPNLVESFVHCRRSHTYD